MVAVRHFWQFVIPHVVHFPVELRYCEDGHTMQEEFEAALVTPGLHMLQTSTPVVLFSVHLLHLSSHRAQVG